MLRARLAILILAALALLTSGVACGSTGETLLPATDSSALELPPTPPVTPSRVLPTLSAPTIAPAAPVVVTPAATAAVVAGDDNGEWRTLRTGLERRHFNMLTEDGNVLERLYLLRIDPAAFYFDIGYKPGAPQRLMDWQTETGALIVVNGGYFTADNIATGLVVSNGQASGASYVGFGGMLAIRDGYPSIRPLSQQPYNPGEPLQAGLQSFPLLIGPDGQMAYPDEDGQADRRTVIAQDRQGRFLLIVASTGTLTLHQMSRFLAESDLEVATALNLDGGASTGIQVADPVEGVAPFSLLPLVITVRPRV